MPVNNGRIQAVYLPTGNPDTTNVATLYKPGELGAKFDSQNGGIANARYQRVQVDSGATAAASSGVVAANEIAFWKDKTQYLVTNDLRFSNRNQPAGIFRVAATAGFYVDIIGSGTAVPVKTTGSPGVGDEAIANSGSAADAAAITIGTAGTYRTIGIFSSTVSGGNANVDLDIPEVD